MRRAFSVIRCDAFWRKGNWASWSTIRELLGDGNDENEFIAMTTEKARPILGRGRFAPSTTGRAHPGTLLAALLCWLDARRVGAEIVLRLEDLDRERTKVGYVDQLDRDLAWFGLDWDRRVLQSDDRERHEEALEHNLFFLFLAYSLKY